MSRPPAWSEAEDEHLIDLRESGLIGDRMNTAFQILYPERSAEAIKQHLQILRRDQRVR